MCLQLKALATGGHYPNDIFEPGKVQQGNLHISAKNGSWAKPRWIRIPEPSSVIRFKPNLRFWFALETLQLFSN